MTFFFFFSLHARVFGLPFLSPTVVRSLKDNRCSIYFSVYLNGYILIFYCLLLSTAIATALLDVLNVLEHPFTVIILKLDTFRYHKEAI